MTSGRTAVKNVFPIRCPCPRPALAVLHAQPIIRYFAVFCSCPSSFVCAILRPCWVLLHHVPEVAPPVGGCPAFPVRQAFVRWDVEGVGSRLWGGPFPAHGAWRGPGLCRCRNERLRPAQVRDPHASLVWLVDVEPPDPGVDEVVRDLQPGGDEGLELPHRDVGGCGVRHWDHGEEAREAARPADDAASPPAPPTQQQREEPTVGAEDRQGPPQRKATPPSVEEPSGGVD